jgi:hypothetical protein
VSKVWVLDTATKGTGASMVPLESTLAKPEDGSGSIFVPPKPAPRPPRPTEPRQPPKFKVVDVVSAMTLAEDVDARAALALLDDARSVTDVRIHVWSQESRSWRLLTLREQKALWGLRHGHRRDGARPAGLPGPRTENDRSPC